MKQSTKNPFIAGNWVRGENFFGREKLIHEILEGSSNYLWIAGTRRLGKTSLLKQLELLTTEGEYADKFIPLFWDLQGSQDVEGLKESLLESIEDAEDRFDDIGVELDELEKQDLFSILRKLRRCAKEKNMNLLLLCDEAEELINIEKSNPEALPKLRRFFQRGDNVYTVLMATKRLRLLEESAIPNTSPFLHGFVPPTYLLQFDDSAARKLVQQGKFDNETTTEILGKSAKHPYLLQLICKRQFETGDLQKILEEIRSDEMISHFFAVDFKYLDPEQQEILLHLLKHKDLTTGELQEQFNEPKEQIIKDLYELLQLGFITEESGCYTIANYFFKMWLEREQEKLFSRSSLNRVESSIEGSKSTHQTFISPEIGDKLGQHELLGKLGTGGMGVVFKARDQKLNRHVAIKILHAHLTDDEEFKQRFIQEAQAASAINHPNITTIYQIGDEQGLLFISMEFVEGQTLREMIERIDHLQDGFPLGKMLNYATQIAEGLHAAHTKGIIHRDIKPENIMVNDKGQVKVMDFGLAKYAIGHGPTLKLGDKGITKTGTTLGTLSYMSPEQASGLETDHRTDIFSFGVVLYEMFTGVLPFSGEYELSVLYAIINEKPKPILEINPELPEELCKIVEKALEKKKEKRYQNMEALLNDLEKLRH